MYLFFLTPYIGFSNWILSYDNLCMRYFKPIRNRVSHSSIKIFMRGVKSRRQTTGGLTSCQSQIVNKKWRPSMCLLTAMKNLIFFTADEVRQAEIRDLEKAFEADDAESDIEVSDISDEESCDDNSDEHSDSEDDIALADIAGLRWSEILRPLASSEFSGRTPGPSTKMDGSKTELDFLDLLFVPSFYENIAKETNSYARKQLAAGTQWSDMSADEVKAFLGACIVMGILQAPAQDMYWLKDKLFHPSCLEQKFTRSRFEKHPEVFSCGRHVVESSSPHPRSR